jgi:fermentation-respiration switch protein FrsA (DUF1100 family)
MERLSRLTAIAIIAFCLGAGCLCLPENTIHPLLALEESLVFWPLPYPRGDWSKPVGVEDAWFQSVDGAELHGWYAAAPQARAMVLYAHGNAGNITQLRPYLELFRDRLHVSILVFDYRGYGRSRGHPSEAGVLEDARAARAWLASRAGVPEADIVLVGHSLGGGVVVDLAAGDGARGLVLESTFTSLPDAAQSHVPVRRLMHMHFDSLAKIGRYHGPLLQTHGEADRVIPFTQGCRLFAAANEPKEFVAVPGGGHNDPPAAVYVQALDRFFSTLSVPATAHP